MALVLANRVQETSTTTGTGTLTLDGAVLGYQTFAAGIGSGNTCYYAITSGTGAWEVGIGTVGTGTLARTTLLSSSTGSLVSFTGTLNVYVTYPSEKSVNLDASGVVTGYPITVKDNVFTLQDDADPTKQAQFQLSSITTATTRSYTLPNNDTVLAGLSGTETFSGSKTFSGATNVFGSSSISTTQSLASGATTTGNTKTVNIGTGGLSGSTTTIAIGSSVSGATSTTTMNGTTNFLDSGLTIQNAADTTKKATFSLASVGTGTSVVYTMPVASGTIPTLSSTNTWTAGVTFSAASGSYGTNANASTYNFASGATISGATKTVNFGTGGVSGSTTNITIGSSVSGATSTTTHNGVNLFTGVGYSANFALTDAATIAWDSNNQVATFTFVSSNRTMGAPTNLVNGGFYALAVIQNAGSNTLTWNSVFKWAAGTAPTLSTAAGAKDYFTFRSDGTNLYQQGISQAVA